MADEHEFKEYETRKIMVKALQFRPDGVHQFSLPNMISANFQEARHPGLNAEHPSKWPNGWATKGIKFYIQTINGQAEIKPGDFIIKELEYVNSYYPCEQSTFVRKYVV